LTSEPRLAERIDVYSLRAIAQRLGRLHLGSPSIVSPDTLRGMIRDTSHAVGMHKFTDHFLATEWEQVVDAWQLESWDAYREVARLGRKTRLPEPQRRVLWSIFEQVRAALAAKGVLTEAALFTRLAGHFGSGAPVPFDFAVVDEAQDLSVSQMRFLAALGAGRPNGLFFAGDLGQRIF